MANHNAPDRVYSTNQGQMNVIWESQSNTESRSIAWGDVDGDGDLDLAIAVVGGANEVWRNSEGSFISYWTSEDTKESHGRVRRLGPRWRP